MQIYAYNHLHALSLLGVSAENVSLQFLFHCSSSNVCCFFQPLFPSIRHVSISFPKLSFLNMYLKLQTTAYFSFFELPHRSHVLSMICSNTISKKTYEENFPTFTAIEKDKYSSSALFFVSNIILLCIIHLLSFYMISFVIPI